MTPSLLLIPLCALELVTTSGFSIQCLPPTERPDEIEIPAPKPEEQNQFSKYTYDVEPDPFMFDDEKDFEEFMYAIENAEKFDPIRHESYLFQ